MDFDVFELDRFELQSGIQLRPARLAYKTWGRLSSRRDNVVLFPTWYSSNHGHNEWLIGEARALDPKRFYIVSPNMLGNGLSSSPSNTAPPYDRTRFPLVTILDNVRLQHRLLTEGLGVERLRLVIGRSMGAQQAFQWASYFPDMVHSVLPIEGAARTTPHCEAFLEGVRAALTTDCVWKNGEYDSPPNAGIRAMGRLYAGWAMSQAFYREGLHLRDAPQARSVRDYLEQRWDRNFARCDANDLLAMLETWRANDVSGNERHKGDFAAALGAIRCRAIVMPSRTDLYFPPEDSAAAVRLMPNAELRVIESVWGHRAGAPGGDPRDIAFIEAAAAELLAH